MNGLHFLRSDDFRIMTRSGKPLLHTMVPGFSLLLFYSTNCQYCKNLIPIFKTLPGKIGGCNIGVIDVGINKQCILMSRETEAPINVVPYIAFYVNGQPYMRYKGPADENEIMNFVVTAAKLIQNSKRQQGGSGNSGQLQQTQEHQTFNSGQRAHGVDGTQNYTIKQDTDSSIPAFTIAHPLCGEGDVCYLEFLEAYRNESSGPEILNRPHNKSKTYVTVNQETPQNQGQTNNNGMRQAPNRGNRFNDVSGM